MGLTSGSEANDVIAGVVDATYQMLRNDPKSSRFAARSIDSQKRARQLLVDQICQLAGGPCVYIGRDMKTSHAGPRITEDEWETVMSTPDRLSKITALETRNRKR